MKKGPYLVPETLLLVQQQQQKKEEKIVSNYVDLNDGRWPYMSNFY